MKRVLLINPPVLKWDRGFQFEVHFPIGLMSIAGNIKDIADVKILDCTVGPDFQIEKLNDGTTLYGSKGIDRIAETMKKFSPDVVGITAHTTQTEVIKGVCQVVKSIKNDCIVILGGPYASVLKEYLLKETTADYCIVGEGEQAMRDYLLTGLVSDTPTTIHNLDDLQYPAYSLVDFTEYYASPYLYKGYRKGNDITMITSRGCPYSCTFCSIKLHMGRRYRSHSAEYVLTHMKYLNWVHGVNHFHFDDDNISLDKERFEAILDGIIESELKITWDTPNGIRADTLDYELMKKMKKSGCVRLSFAVESANQRVLNKIVKKNTSISMLKAAFINCKTLRIPCSVFYVVGFPGETVHEMLETARFAVEMMVKHNACPSLFAATPMYGTDLYNECVSKGYISEHLSDEQLALATQVGGEPLISTEDFTCEDVKKVVDEYSENLRKQTRTYLLKNPAVLIKKIWGRIRK